MADFSIFVLARPLKAMERRVRLVLLVAHTPNGEVQHRYVAKKIASEFPDELSAIIVATGIRRSLAEQCKRWWKRYSVREIGSRLLVRLSGKLTARGRRQQDVFRSVLFPEGDDGEMPRPDILHRVPSHNGPECLRLIADIDPDIVIVYGTMIIGSKVIAASRKLINLHTGLSPVYRGSDTIFWPLHNGEPEHLGVTVHRLDAGVDSGPILARGKPTLEPGDDADRLFAKSVAVGAELLCRAVRRDFEGKARPLGQDLQSGREYKSVQRTLAAERRTRKLLRNGLISKARPAWSEEY